MANISNPECDVNRKTLRPQPRVRIGMSSPLFIVIPRFLLCTGQPPDRMKAIRNPPLRGLRGLSSVDVVFFKIGFLFAGFSSGHNGNNFHLSFSVHIDEVLPLTPDIKEMVWNYIPPEDIRSLPRLVRSWACVNLLLLNHDSMVEAICQ